MEKILSFIIKDNKLLLLLGSENDPQFHDSFWYVVTGEVEKQDKNLYDTVKREINEETNLDTIKIIDLNLTYKYKSLNKNCNEHVFISYVSDNEIILNEENLDYKWCTLDEFIEKIKWYYDKKELNKLLKKYIN